MSAAMRSRKQWLIARVEEIVSAMHHSVCSNGQLPEQDWLDELGELLEQVEDEQ